MRRAPDRRRRPLAAGLSVAGHIGLLTVLLMAPRDTPSQVESAPMVVRLASLPPPAEPAEPAPKSLRVATAPEPPPRRSSRRIVAAPAAVPAPPGSLRSAGGEGEIEEAALAGAATAGSGGGRPCDMVGWLQDALRKDRTVQAAVAGADRGKALQIWNGAWVRHGSQEGAGLAAVRESIMWHVAFAPEACRAEPVRGLVVISLGEAPGSARLVLGSGTWRWTDLLFARGAAR